MAYRTQKASNVVDLKPPQSIEAEQSVLGAILKSGTAINSVIDILPDPQDFYSPRHQMIYRAILDLYEKSEPCDITTVVNQLETRNELEKVGGRVYLVELIELVASTANVTSHADIVLERGVLRRLIAASNEISSDCYTLEMPVDQLLDRAESNIFSISESRLRQGFVPIKGLINEEMDRIEKMRGGEGSLGGLKTGYHLLDERTLGLHAGELTIIAGRPSMGKTALALNIAENIALNEKEPKSVGMFSIEMSRAALVFRLLCGLAGVNQHTIRSGKLSDKEWGLLVRATGRLYEAPVYIDDSPSLTALELRAKSRRLKAQQGLDLIVVDYIQLMQSHGRVENRQQEISVISRNLKALAKELEIPVIALSQLSRQVEQRGGERRPQLADLRESGAIEQDADLVLLLYREEFYRSHLDRNDPKFLEVQGMADVIIAKQRNGPTGTVKLSFRSELARFANLEKTHRELPGGVEPVGDGDTPF